MSITLLPRYDVYTSLCHIYFILRSLFTALVQARFCEVVIEAAMFWFFFCCYNHNLASRPDSFSACSGILNRLNLARIFPAPQLNHLLYVSPQLSLLMQGGVSYILRHTFFVSTAYILGIFQRGVGFDIRMIRQPLERYIHGMPALG
jgi:hypothetical protein